MTHPVENQILPTQLPDLLCTERSFLLTGHENPDGDCLGAQCALYHLLVAMGKQVAIVNPDPIGPGFDFLQAHTPYGYARGDEPLPPFDVAVLLDCAELRRVGNLGARLRRSGATIAVIDHHVGSEHGDGTVAFVDHTAAATGALVRRLYKLLDQPLGKAAAEGVFLSLVADTGWFRYSNTDPEVLEMAAELVRIGVEPAAMYDLLYRRLHPDSPMLLAQALQQSQLRLQGQLAITCLDRFLMERAARVDFDTDLVMDPLRSLVGVEVVALLKERFDGQVKLSLRAKGDLDVQRIAAAFGGGGHKKAAGASLGMSLAAAAAAVEAQVQAQLASRGPSA